MIELKEEFDRQDNQINAITTKPDFHTIKPIYMRISSSAFSLEQEEATNEVLEMNGLDRAHQVHAQATIRAYKEMFRDLKRLVFGHS